MGETTTNTTGGAYGAVRVALFLCLFAGQAALIVMSPVLANAASDLHVSTAAAGQLRTITGLAAGIAALMLGAFAGRLGVGRQLLAGSMLLALGSIASAAAPTFALLALAQLPVGVAVAALTTAGTLAAAEWVSPAQRTKTLSWALLGQPTAWIVGMPLIGLLGERSWRYGWLALPLAAAVATGILVAPRSGRPPARSQPGRIGAALGDRSPRALAGVRALRERGLGRNARLCRRSLRRVVRDLHQADGLPARGRGRRQRRRQPVLPSPRRTRATAGPRPARPVPRRHRQPLRSCPLGRRYEHSPSLERRLPRRRADADRERVRARHAAPLAAGRDQPPSRDDAAGLLRRLDRRRCRAHPRRLQRARRHHGPLLPRRRSDARPPSGLAEHDRRARRRSGSRGRGRRVVPGRRLSFRPRSARRVLPALYRARG